ncbi:hypothetical protein [Paenibacillus lautus]|uniref:hypothetical protein n=1 Tax=Paenibacillus lautus TaxID=1401 RepID=UPI003D2AC515
MSVKNYEKRIPVQAIQFQGIESTHMQEVIDFVGMPVSVDFAAGGIRLRVIRGAYDVIVAYVGDYIIKEANGNLKRASKEDFEAEYTEVV